MIFTESLTLEVSDLLLRLKSCFGLFPSGTALSRIDDVLTEAVVFALPKRSVRP